MTCWCSAASLFSVYSLVICISKLRKCVAGLACSLRASVILRRSELLEKVCDEKVQLCWTTNLNPLLINLLNYDCNVESCRKQRHSNQILCYTVMGLMWGVLVSMIMCWHISCFLVGAYGAAVLYRKKDDDSLVILKEISLHELTAAERQMAMNEVMHWIPPWKLKISK